MDPKYNKLHVGDLDVDDVIPVDRRPIVKYCKIDCLGNNATYIGVQSALECVRAGRAGYSTITYAPLEKKIECENIYEFYLDHIRDVFDHRIVVSFKKDD